MNTYKDWIQKERNGFWINTVTGQESVFHPQAIEIAAPLYQKATKWIRKTTDDLNKKRKEKRP